LLSLGLGFFQRVGPKHSADRNNDGRNRPGHAGPLAPRFLLQHHTARSTL
jgi:hypothetical protein